MMRHLVMSAIGALGLCASARADVLNGLVGRWSFDNHYLDSSGSGFHSTPRGAPEFGPGQTGQAACFDGVDDWLEVPHGGALTFDSDVRSFTIASFFRLAELSPGVEYTIIQDRFGSNHPVAYNLIVRGTAQGCEVSAGTWYGEQNNVGVALRVPMGAIAGSWHHVALTMNHGNRTARMYIDGQLVAQQSFPAADWMPGSGNIVTLGGYWSSNGVVENLFKGCLDEVRIYDRALSDAEIAVIAAPEPQTPVEVGPPCSTASVHGFETTPVGQFPAGWQVNQPGGGQAVSNARAAEGRHSFRVRGLPSASSILRSTETHVASRGQAALSFRSLLSSEATAVGPDANSVIVSYMGEHGTFSLGFQRNPLEGPSAPLRVSRTNIPVLPDRWYSFKAIADYDHGTVDIYLDGVRVAACVPLGAGDFDPARRNRLELEVGNIADGETIGYFDEIVFVPPTPGLASDANNDGMVNATDIFIFLDAWFARR